MRDAIRHLARPDAMAVLTRFPVAALSSVMLGGRALLPEGLDLDWNDPSTAWTFGWVVVLMSSVAIAIWAESRRSASGLPLQTLSLLLGLGAYLAWETPFVSPLWTIIALFALMLLSPAPRRDEQALWSYDARATALFVFAVIAAVTLALGLIAIIEAAEYLFDMDFDYRATSRILNVCFWFVLPVYWLALLPGPEDPPLQPGDLLFKAVATLGALLAVVIGVLALLLHAYAAKIVLSGVVPKGQVGWIVSVTLSAGLLGWLVSAADCGPALGLRRLFRRWWFPLTLVPTALLVFAVRERIGAYGVTADRYALGAAAAVSIGFLALWLARRRPPTIRAVLIVGAAVSLLAAVGPLNMPGVVAESQIARLKQILNEEGLLSDGRVTSPVPMDRWSNERANQIASIISTIDGVSAQSQLAEILPPDKAASRIGAQTFLGAEFRGVSTPDTRSFYISRPTPVVELDAGVLIGPFQISRPPGDEVPSPNRFTFDGAVFVLQATKLKIAEGGREIVFELEPLNDVASATDRGPIALKSTDGRSELSVTNAMIYRRDGGFELSSLGGVVLLSKP